MYTQFVTRSSDWVTLQLPVSQSVSQSVIALSASMTPDQILAADKQYYVRTWRHGASSLMGGRVCLLYSTLYWILLVRISLNHLQLTDRESVSQSVGPSVLALSHSYFVSVCRCLSVQAVSYSVSSASRGRKNTHSVLPRLTSKSVCKI